MEAAWQTKGWNASASGTYLILAGPGNWMLQDLRLHHFAVSRLPIETRAAAIGGFTPLAHGTPEFFAARWMGEPARQPAPFREDENIPQAKALPSPAELNAGKLDGGAP